MYSIDSLLLIHIVVLIRYKYSIYDSIVIISIWIYLVVLCIDPLLFFVFDVLYCVKPSIL
ncbi:MAG: hypothetical protein ACI8RD_010018 [Bacillariaceae sp.]|jgi:hypothetical protein